MDKQIMPDWFDPKVMAYLYFKKAHPELTKEQLSEIRKEFGIKKCQE